MIKKYRMVSSVMAAAMTLCMIPAGSVNAGEVLTQTGGGQLIGEEGGYSYELWQSNSGCGTSTMTLNDGATFDCQWDCSGSQGNFLARRGMRFDCTQTYKDIGNIAFDYSVDYNPGNQGSSYLCVYGWTREPLVEYYIVDNWKNWRPPNGAAQASGAQQQRYPYHHRSHSDRGTHTACDTGRELYGTDQGYPDTRCR